MNENIFAFIVLLLEKHGPFPEDDEKGMLAYRFLETGHIDSFQLNEFIMEIEDRYNIALSPEDIQSENFRSIGGLIEIVKNRIQSSK